MKTSLIKTLDRLTQLTDKVQILKRKTDTLLSLNQYEQIEDKLLNLESLVSVNKTVIVYMPHQYALGAQLTINQQEIWLYYDKQPFVIQLVYPIIIQSARIPAYQYGICEIKDKNGTVLFDNIKNDFTIQSGPSELYLTISGGGKYIGLEQ